MFHDPRNELTKNTDGLEGRWKLLEFVLFDLRRKFVFWKWKEKQECFRKREGKREFSPEAGRKAGMSSGCGKGSMNILRKQEGSRSSLEAERKAGIFSGSANEWKTVFWLSNLINF